MICYENGHDNLCRQFTEEFSLSNLINQKTKKGDNLFLLTVKDGNDKLSNYFIEKADVELNFRDKNGKTALMYACEAGNYHLVELLINKNADLNISDRVIFLK